MSCQVFTTNGTLGCCLKLGGESEAPVIVVTLTKHDQVISSELPIDQARRFAIALNGDAEAGAKEPSFERG